MRTLSEIISAAKSNEPVDVEELRYALCALEGLASFDSMDERLVGRDGNLYVARLCYARMFQSPDGLKRRCAEEFGGSPVLWRRIDDFYMHVWLDAVPVAAVCQKCFAKLRWTRRRVN